MGIAEPIYNRIGETYNATRQADPYLLSRLCALLAPTAEGNYLDIGCGSGNYTAAMAGAGFRFTGIDPAEVMLKAARQKPEPVRWLAGRAEKMPVPDACFDGDIATLTVHHWPSLAQGFGELYRVLQPGAQVVLFTSTPEQMQGYWLTHYFPGMLSASRATMPSLDAITEAAAHAGFVRNLVEPYFVQPDLKDCFLYVGKHNPLLYFVPAIRAGISSFATLSVATEVEMGLARLKTDIENGTFGQVRQKFANQLGDYLFVRFGK